MLQTSKAFKMYIYYYYYLSKKIMSANNYYVTQDFGWVFEQNAILKVMFFLLRTMF